MDAETKLIIAFLSDRIFLKHGPVRGLQVCRRRFWKTFLWEGQEGVGLHVSFCVTYGQIKSFEGVRGTFFIKATQKRARFENLKGNGGFSG